MKVLRHNKYKNTGLIFEILTRKLVAESMEKKPGKSAAIIRKYFQKGTELHTELGLYHTLQETNIKPSICSKIVDAVVETRATAIDKVKLIVEKYELIGSLKRAYDIDEFFKSRVTNYKTTASICKLFENSTTDNPLEYIKCRELIEEGMCDTPKVDELNEVQTIWKTQDKDIRKLAFKILVEKFNKKYSGLGSDQKALLKLFVSEDINSSVFKDYVYSEIDKIRTILESKANELDNNTIRIKIHGVTSLLDSIIASKYVKNEHVSALLKYYELIGKL